MNATPDRSSGGFVRVVRRELSRMASAPFYVLGLVVFPVASALLIVAIFGSGVVRDLPISVIDEDASQLSRQLSRMIDATPGLRVAFSDASMAEARGRVLRGESYGVVAIPREFERHARRGEVSRVSVFFNGQYLVPASTVRRDAAAAIGTLSASVEAGQRAGSGQLPSKVLEVIEPITIDAHTIGNPALSYVPYLVTGLLPTLLQIFVMVMAVHAYGSELRAGTAGEWFEAAGGRAWAALAGKALPYAVYFIALALLMLALLFGWLEVPLLGHAGVVAGATVLLVLAYLAMGFAAVALSGNLRLATSLAAFYSVPAFAFAGLTFPTYGMPVLGQAWSSLLPISHYLKVLVEQALRGAPLWTAERPLLWLCGFAVVPWLMLGWRMSALARDPRAWGRL
jgi:ABC-2 type transport system permease protein